MSNFDHLTPNELCVEIAIAAFLDDHSPRYSTGIFGHLSPTGKLQTPYRPTKLVNCLEFLVDAASGSKKLPEATQAAVDDYVGSLIVSRELRNG